MRGTKIKRRQNRERFAVIKEGIGMSTDKCKKCGELLMPVESGLVCPNGHGKLILHAHTGATLGSLIGIWATNDEGEKTDEEQE